MRLARRRMPAVVAAVVILCSVVLVGLSQRSDNAQAASGTALASPVSALAATATAQHATASCQSPRWYRGQVHAHTGLPTAPVPAPQVVDWYKSHGFHFMAVTGLNSWVDPAPLQAQFGEAGKFLVVGGEELSMEPLGVGVKIYDTLGIGFSRALEVPNIPGASATASLDAEAKVIRAEPGPQLVVAAHPGLTYAYEDRELLASDRRPGRPRYVEIWNGESGMNFLPGGDWPGVERIVDRALTRGRLVYLVASDDSHHFTGGPFPAEAHVAEPGRGWVVVRACALNWPTIIAAMERGDFYSSSGVTLLEYQASRRGISLKLDPTTHDLGWSVDATNTTKYTTTFIGAGGRVLKVSTSLTPSYRFKAKDRYVRARVVDSDGRRAWTQPVFHR
jgi:hypothetical protein